MKNRIKKIRKELDLTQQEFADRIGIKRGGVANYEIGRNEPADAVISLICREFNINEHWLRDGTGEMFIEMTKDEEIATWVGKILHDEDAGFQRRLINAFSKMDSKGWDALEKFINNLLDDMKKD